MSTAITLNCKSRTLFLGSVLVSGPLCVWFHTNSLVLSPNINFFRSEMPKWHRTFELIINRLLRIQKKDFCSSNGFISTWNNFFFYNLAHIPSLELTMSLPYKFYEKNVKVL